MENTRYSSDWSRKTQDYVLQKTQERTRDIYMIWKGEGKIKKIKIK